VDELCKKKYNHIPFAEIGTKFSVYLINPHTMQEKHYLVPQHNEGFEKDIAHEAVAKTIEDAEDWFVDAKERLLDINNWKKYAPGLGVEFRLSDGHGKGLHRSARRGDHVRIDIQGPAGGLIGGFDWSTIEAMEYDDYPDEDMETFAIRIRPSDHPQDGTDGVPVLVAGNDVSATVVVARFGKRLSAAYHGRNELAGADMKADDRSNEDPGNGWMGISDVQWGELMKGLLK
jgi:hypothetical protein